MNTHTHIQRTTVVTLAGRMHTLTVNYTAGLTGTKTQCFMHKQTYNGEYMKQSTWVGIN